MPSFEAIFGKNLAKVPYPGQHVLNDQKKPPVRTRRFGLNTFCQELMPRSITGPCGGCLPTDGRHIQRVRELAEMQAIASGFRNPELAGEHAVRIASKQSGGAL